MWVRLQTVLEAAPQQHSFQCVSVRGMRGDCSANFRMRFSCEEGQKRDDPRVSSSAPAYCSNNGILQTKRVFTLRLFLRGYVRSVKVQRTVDNKMYYQPETGTSLGH